MPGQGSSTAQTAAPPQDPRAASGGNEKTDGAEKGAVRAEAVESRLYRGHPRTIGVSARQERTVACRSPPMRFVKLFAKSCDMLKVPINRPQLPLAEESAGGQTDQGG